MSPENPGERVSRSCPGFRDALAGPPLCAREHAVGVSIRFLFSALLLVSRHQMRVAGLLKLPKVSDSLRQTSSHLPAAADPENGRLQLGDSIAPCVFPICRLGPQPKSNRRPQTTLSWVGKTAENSFHPFTAIPTGRVTAGRGPRPWALFAQGRI